LFDAIANKTTKQPLLTITLAC